MTKRCQITLLLTIAATFFFSGCKTAEPLGAVVGRVTIAGTPLSGVALAFEAEAGGSNILIDVGDNGTYAVKTYKGAGLPPGSYRVTVRPATPKNPEGSVSLATDKANPVALPPFADKYLVASTSGLHIDVREGTNPPFNFDLEKR